jgi:hypothetical protein
MNLFARIARLTHIDNATFFSIVSRSWSGFSGIVSVALIAKTLSPVEQGYYFTFSSLLALQVVLELGFSYVIAQVAAHEFALSEQHELSSVRDRARSRLISLFRLSLKWYGCIAVIFYVFCSLGGDFFFRATSSSAASSWRMPWLLAVMAFALSLNLIPLYAFLEGCNRVSKVAKTRTVQDIVGYGTLWGMFLFGQGLYAVPAMYFARIIGGVSGLLLTGQFQYLLSMLRSKTGLAERISWKREIFPFQWKIALSWFSGYLVFQMIGPVLFAEQGAKAAGQAGMTIAIFSGFSSLMVTWVTTRAPYFCQLIALHRYAELKIVFRKIVLTSTIISALGLALLVLGLMVARAFIPAFSERILGNGSIVCFALASLANHLVNSFAIYLRAHKEEPFLTASVAVGALMSITVLALSHISTNAVAIGYSGVVIFVSLPWASIIFISKRKRYPRAF